MAFKNRCRKSIFITKANENIYPEICSHETVNPKVATENVPKVFLCFFVLKNVFRFDDV